jgi:hypothetical protein
MGPGGDEEVTPLVDPPAVTGGRRSRPSGRVLLIAVVGLVAILAAGLALSQTVLKGSTPGGSLPGHVPMQRVTGDFVADQAAREKALESGDITKATGYITGNSLQDLGRLIQSNELASATERTQFLGDPTLEVLQEADPNDPQTNVEVHQYGYLRVSLVSKAIGEPLSQRDLKFDNRFWLRPLHGRYAITDGLVSQEAGSPPSPPWVVIAIGAALIVAIGLAALVLRRQRQLAAAGALGTMAPPDPGMASTATGAGDLPAPLWAGGDPTDAATVGIRTIGGFQIWSEGKDLAPTLLKNEVSSFMLLSLLVQAILHPETRVTRDELGESVFPKIPAKARHSRTRKRLHAIRNYTPALAARLLEDSGLSFDLTGCRVDAIELLDLARSCLGSAVLPPELVPKAEQLVTLTAGRFLPFWEVLDEKVTGGDGPSVEPVEVIRGRLEVARADVLAALGGTHVASGQAQRAIAVLEEARRMRPEREDVANQLVVAYRAIGRDEEAERVLQGTDVET